MVLSSSHERRRFLQASLTGTLAVGVQARVPQFLLQAAGASRPESERILVVVQLTGGNDGLNTVVPYANELYHRARPKLALGKSQVLRISDELGFHPELTGMRELLDQSQLTVIQGVGYEQPNRSHFESMDIWHTCRRKQEQRGAGWLGRFLDDADAGVGPSGGDVAALHFGRSQQPLALASRQVRVPSITSLEEFQLRGSDREALRQLISSLPVQPDTAAPTNDLLQFVQSSTSAAMLASQRVAQASKAYQSAAPYPSSPLAEKLHVVAQLIDSGLSTRIYYVELDGFDTHAQQAATHAALLKEWSNAIAAFVNDLQAHGQAERVCVMSFSEFGRRLAENASQGTDHGAAAPMFLCGGRVNAGFVGTQPSLTDLNDGDIQYAIDFRQVYATVLRKWLDADATKILGAEYAELPLFI